MAADAETCKGDVGGWDAKLVETRSLALCSYRRQKNQGWRLSLRNEPERKGKNEGKRKGKKEVKSEEERKRASVQGNLGNVREQLQISSTRDYTSRALISSDESTSCRLCMALVLPQAMSAGNPRQINTEVCSFGISCAIISRILVKEEPRPVRLKSHVLRPRSHPRQVSWAQQEGNSRSNYCILSALVASMGPSSLCRRL